MTRKPSASRAEMLPDEPAGQAALEDRPRPAADLVAEACSVGVTPVPPSTRAPRAKKSSPPKLPDLSASASGGVAVDAQRRHAGVDLGADLERDRRRSAETTAPEVSPPATTMRRKPAADGASRAVAAKIASKPRGERARGRSAAWLRRPRPDRRRNRRAAPSPRCLRRRRARARRRGSGVERVLGVELQRRVAARDRRRSAGGSRSSSCRRGRAPGRGAPRKRRSPAPAARCRSSPAGRAAMPEPPVTSAWPRGSARRARSRSASSIASATISRSPRGRRLGQRRGAARRRAAPASGRWPTGSRVCRASQRRMSGSVIGVSGWLLHARFAEQPVADEEMALVDRCGRCPERPGRPARPARRARRAAPRRPGRCCPPASNRRSSST